jgi:tricorn protease
MTSPLAFVVVAAAAAFSAAAPAAVPAPSGPELGPLRDPLWLRYGAISADGREIVFAFQGDLFVVPTAGGTARTLVATGHRSFQPVWSPDGRSIAYAADVHGNFDVFVVSAQGGPSRRLTTHSAPELPLGFTPDGREVMFSAQRLDARSSVQFPGRAVSELYKVPVDAAGRRPVQVFSVPALAAQFNRAGTQIVYEDWKGYESPWRKHHVSPVARDIWLYDTRSGQHRALSRFGGEDRNPVWSADEQAVYFLSERSGSFNVWKMPLEQPDAAVQVTQFTRNPVRFLSIAADGTLSFGHDGELYTLAPEAGAQPRKLPIQIAADTQPPQLENLKLSHGATEIATSPDGQELALILRGDVFVVSTEFGDTRRITSTPQQERSVSFSPDGRRLLFAGEREGSWNLYEARLEGSRKQQPYFFAGAAPVPVRTLLKNGRENFQPRYSPDGKEVAYLEDRTTLKVLSLEGPAKGKTRTVMPGEMSYSYSDGDQWFDWSPDGQSLLVNFVDRERWGMEVGLVDAQGKGGVRNLTLSGYEDTRPIWTRGGQAMLWVSDRMGLRGTGGAAQQDVFTMFFTREAYDRFRLDKSEYALLKKQEDDKTGKDGNGDKESDDESDKNAQDSKQKKPASPEQPMRLPPPVKIEFDGLEDRVARLTPNSGQLRAAAMTPDGEMLLFVHETADALDLWLHRPRQKSLKKVASFPAAPPEPGGSDPVDLQLDAKGEMGFVLAGGQIQKFKLPKDAGKDAGKDAPDIKPERLEFNAELTLDRVAERSYLFEHVWRQTREKLYAKDMGGVDWDGYRKVYEKFLPFVANNHDFAEVLSEMLGELNVSHTGAGFRGNKSPNDDATAALGLFADESHTGAGIKVAEVIAGGPLDAAPSPVRAGMVIEAIDGQAITAGAEWDSLLNRKAGKPAALSVRDPATGRRFEHTVKPISLGDQQGLLYRRWTKTQREMVDKLSGGKLGYVHVRGMDDASYRDVVAEVLGRHSGKQALIVDTRFNGGGNLHDELVTFLGGRRYLEFMPRDQSLGWQPTGKWNRPSLVLISESNYSDAHLFPWTYRHLGLGPLLGMPVAGTGTAVWWETLQDDSLYFGIPEVGFRDAKGEYMEKALVTPDIVVPHDPALLDQGRDLQTEGAVKALLKP